MEAFVSWFGFVGAWLLVAGPIYQASLEIRSEDTARARIETLAARVPPPPPVSPWWWLLPPVRLFLQRRRTEVYRRAYVDVLSVDDLAVLLAFMHKASGWMLVGGGGLLLAVQETYRRCHDVHLGTVAFLLITLGMAFACVFGTALRIRLGDAWLKDERERKARSSPPESAGAMRG